MHTHQQKPRHLQHHLPSPPLHIHLPPQSHPFPSASRLNCRQHIQNTFPSSLAPPEDQSLLPPIPSSPLLLTTCRLHFLQPLSSWPFALSSDHPQQPNPPYPTEAGGIKDMLSALAHDGVIAHHYWIPLRFGEQGHCEHGHDGIDQRQCAHGTDRYPRR